MHTIITSLKNKVIDLKTKGLSNETIRIIIKESLQDFALSVLYSDTKYSDFVFVGGTALRKLYNLPRFSEDLDFSVGREINYQELGQDIIKYFHSIDFNVVDFSIQKSINVNRLLVRFEISNQIGLSDNSTEKIHIKIETTKDKIYRTELFDQTLSNIPMVITSYPLQTLMTGKILACINRVYLKGKTGITIKGRDYYDLLWYMQKQIIPNEQKLLDSNSEYNLNYVFKLIDERVEKIKISDLKLDLLTLFEDINYIKKWCENFHEFYKRYRIFYK